MKSLARRVVYLLMVTTVLVACARHRDLRRRGPKFWPPDAKAWAIVEARAHRIPLFLEWAANPNARTGCEDFVKWDQALDPKPKDPQLRVLVGWYIAAEKACAKCSGDVDAHCARAIEHRDRIRAWWGDREIWWSAHRVQELDHAEAFIARARAIEGRGDPKLAEHCRRQLTAVIVDAILVTGVEAHRSHPTEYGVVAFILEMVRWCTRCDRASLSYCRIAETALERERARLAVSAPRKERE